MLDFFEEMKLGRGVGGWEIIDEEMVSLNKVLSDTVFYNFIRISKVS